MDRREGFKEKVRRAVRKIVAAQEVKADFAPGRRRTDIVLVALKGDRAPIMNVPIAVLEAVDEVDIELLSLEGGRADSTALTFMVTELLARQPTLKQERRAKLKRSLREASAQEPPAEPS